MGRTCGKQSHLDQGAYQALPTEPSPLTTLTLSDETQIVLLRHWRQRTWNKPSFSLFAVTVIALVLSVVLHIKLPYRRVSDRRCSQKLSAYSPVQDSVQYQWTGFGERVFDFSGLSAPEIKSKWDNMIDWGAIGVPYSKLHLLNKSAQISRYTISDQRPDQVYGWFESFHQLHCLNYMRQFAYDNPDNRTDWDIPVWTQLHANHCLMTLLSNILCYADMTPAVWDDTSKDMELWNSIRAPAKCRSHSKIYEWTLTHKLEENVF